MKSDAQESQDPEKKVTSGASPQDTCAPNHPTPEKVIRQDNLKSLEKNGSLDMSILDIEEAIYCSELILTYIAQEGIHVEADILKIIIEAGRKIKEGPLPIDFEVDFWMAFNQLTNQIKPVTILSLKSSLGAYEFDRREDSKKPSLKPLKSQKAVLKYGLMAVFSLIFLIFLQIYWIIGGDAVEKLLSYFNDRAAIQDQLEDLRFANRNASNDFEFNRLKKEYKIVDQKLDAQYRLLLAWNSIWRTMLMLGKSDFDVTDFNRFKYGKELESIASEMQEEENNKSSDKYKQLKKELVKAEIQLEEDKARQNMFLSVFSANFVLNSLQQYFLPLLYGLLGAITYILRTLSIQINQHTYSYQSEINFRLKLALGALTGIAVGWFFSPDSAILGSFSPLALAFLFGYNVDVFFALMDQFIQKINASLAPKSSGKTAVPQIAKD